MSRAMLTLGTGPHAEYLKIAWPSFETFADLHGWDLIDCDPWEGFSERPPSWWKVPFMAQALADGYDEVLFIGADMVIVDPADDITAPADAWQAMVSHWTADGHVPNCDLWLVRPPMIPVLADIWAKTHLVNHGWWEQAAVLELMGFKCEPRPIRQYEETELYRRTHFLDPSFNRHMWDDQPVDHVRIQHATMYPDRASVMREWAAEAAAWSLAK